MTYEVEVGHEGHAFQTGYEILDETGFALIGMSPGNSYFKATTIDKLLRFASNKFSQVRIMIADKPAEHTYRAFGYDQTKSERKARLNGNTLQNHSQRSIDSILEENPEADIELVEWQDQITPNPLYQEAYSEISQLYETSARFREDARATTREVVEKKIKPGVDIEEAIDEGVNYLLKELAFLSASSNMFGEDKVAYIYHDEWPIYERFVNGEYTGEKRKDLGFVIAKES